LVTRDYLAPLQGEFVMQNILRIRRFGALSAFVLAMVLWVPAVGESQSGRPQAFVSFGLEGAAGAANHVLIPDEVSITVGGKVAFQMFGFHQVSIYRVDPNTSRADIEADIVRGPTANYVIDDAAGVDIVSTARRDFEHVGAIHDHLTNPSAFVLQATHPADASITVLNANETLNIEVLFRQPGRYLVLCAIKGHLDDTMFGFVNVN
jgi:plastocyanin